MCVCVYIPLCVSAYIVQLDINTNGIRNISTEAKLAVNSIRTVLCAILVLILTTSFNYSRHCTHHMVLWTHGVSLWHGSQFREWLSIYQYTAICTIVDILTTGGTGYRLTKYLNFLYRIAGDYGVHEQGGDIKFISRINRIFHNNGAHYFLTMIIWLW